MPLAIAAVVLSFGLAACSGRPSRSAKVSARDRAPQGWDIELAPKGEPGERLVVSGVVYRPDRTPAVSVKVRVYHADRHGQYARSGEERRGPRLAGTLRTDERGQYRFHTVMPGSEGGARPHIHYEVWGKGIERQAILLQLDERSTIAPDWTLRPPGMPPELNTSTHPRMMRDKMGVLHCSYNLWLH